MRRTRCQKFLLLALLGALVAFTLVTDPPATPAAPRWRPPRISPTPQSVTPLRGQVVLPDEVRLVTGEHADPAAVGLVKASLRGHDVRTTRDQAAVVVTVGSGADEAVMGTLKSLHVAGPNDLPSQGYVLANGRSGGRGQIVLAGVDDVGTYYAAQTFRQVLDQRPRGVLPSMEVRDWPAFPLRGGMESFYGPAWSWEDRYDQIDFLAAHKMNYFFYGPADDARTGPQWDEPYSAADLGRFEKLVEYAADRHVTFIYRISPEAPIDPSRGICHSDKADRDLLIARFRQLHEIGVRRYVIAWDDVAGNFACDADRDRYGDDPQPLAAAQADVLNDVQSRYFDRNADIEPVITVPTEYYGNETTAYRTRFDRLTTTKMPIYWTGPAVVSPQITGDDADAAQAAFPRHQLVVWDNYPVNDYASNRLFLGPLVARDPALADRTLGITFNEMNQQAPSQLALWTQADYAWNPEAYQPWRSWNASLNGLGAKAARWLRVFAENNRSNAPIGGDLALESPTLTPLVHALSSGYGSGRRIGRLAARLDGYLARMRRAPARLREGMPNQLFTGEAEPWFRQFESTAAAGRDAVSALSAQAGQRGADLWRARLRLEEHRNELSSNPQIVAPGVLEPLFDLAEAESDGWFGQPWNGDAGTPTGGPPPAAGSDLAAITDGRLETAYRADRGPSADESLEVPLEQSHPLQDVVVLRATDDSSTGVVQARHNGRWIDLGRLGGAYTVVPGRDTTADAVRIVWDAGTHAPTVHEVLPRYADAFTGRLNVPDRTLVTPGSTQTINVDVSAIARGPVPGRLKIDGPDGWRATPADQPLNLDSDGRIVRRSYPIRVTVPPDAAGEHTVTATIAAHGKRPVSAQVRVRVGADAGVPYAAMVKADTPSAYWRLGEHDGAVMADASGHSENGTYRPDVELGRPGALERDGDTAARLVGGYADVPSSARLSPTGPYTVEAWVRPSAILPDPGTAIVEKYTGPSKDGFAFRLDGNGRLQAWNLAGDSYALATGETAVSTGQWHHVAAVFDGSNLTVYLDGWPDGTVQTSLAPTAGPASLKIGGRGDDGSQRWRGDLDEVAVYPGPLPADRIATHYLTGR